MGKCLVGHWKRRVRLVYDQNNFWKEMRLRNTKKTNKETIWLPKTPNWRKVTVSFLLLTWYSFFVKKKKVRSVSKGKIGKRNERKSNINEPHCKSHCKRIKRTVNVLIKIWCWTCVVTYVFKEALPSFTFVAVEKRWQQWQGRRGNRRRGEKNFWNKKPCYKAFDGIVSDVGMLILNRHLT